MEQTATVIEAVAALLWPLILVAFLWRFAPAVGAIIESARSRKFTLKVGGQELTVEEVRSQQSNLIADLQSQVAALKDAMERAAIPAVPASPPIRTERAPGAIHGAPARVLWVDDQPKNNSYFVEQLTQAGIEVTLARTTAEALERLERSRYRLIVSDIGRKEGAQYKRAAGIDLLRDVRSAKPDLPFAFYTSAAGVTHRSDEAKAGGANLITASATELTRFLEHHLPEWRPTDA